MKSKIYLYLLLLLVFNCKSNSNNEQIDPDMGASLAGEYKVTTETSRNKGEWGSFGDGDYAKMTVERIDIDHILIDYDGSQYKYEWAFLLKKDGSNINLYVAGEAVEIGTFKQNRLSVQLKKQETDSQGRSTMLYVEGMKK